MRYGILSGALYCLLNMLVSWKDIPQNRSVALNANNHGYRQNADGLDDCVVAVDPDVDDGQRLDVARANPAAIDSIGDQGPARDKKWRNRVAVFSRTHTPSLSAG